MNIARGTTPNRIPHHRNLRQARAINRQRTHVMSRVGQRRRQMLELPRKILMDEEQIHALTVIIVTICFY